MLARPEPVSFGHVQRPDAAVVMPRKRPDDGCQQGHEHGRREGIAHLQEHGCLYTPPQIFHSLDVPEIVNVRFTIV